MHLMKPVIPIKGRPQPVSDSFAILPWDAQNGRAGKHRQDKKKGLRLLCPNTEGRVCCHAAAVSAKDGALGSHSSRHLLILTRRLNSGVLRLQCWFQVWTPGEGRSRVGGSTGCLPLGGTPKALKFVLLLDFLTLLFDDTSPPPFTSCAVILLLATDQPSPPPPRLCATAACPRPTPPAASGGSPSSPLRRSTCTCWAPSWSPAAPLLPLLGLVVGGGGGQWPFGREFLFR